MRHLFRRGNGLSMGSPHAPKVAPLYRRPQGFSGAPVRCPGCLWRLSIATSGATVGCPIEPDTLAVCEIARTRPRGDSQGDSEGDRPEDAGGHASSTGAETGLDPLTHRE